jgi:hypothetical protein
MMRRLAALLLGMLALAPAARAEEDALVGALVEFKGTTAVRAAFRSVGGRWESFGRKGTEAAPSATPGVPIWVVGRQSAAAPFRLGPSIPFTTVSSVSLYGVVGSVPADLFKSAIDVPAWADPARLVPVASRLVSQLNSHTAKLSAEEERALQRAFLASPVIASWCAAPRKCDAERVRILQTVTFEPDVRLSELKLIQDERECDDGWAHCSSLWFAAVKGKEVRPLFQAATTGGDWGFSLTPLVVADFNGDSVTDYLFWLDAYNENGFVLTTHGFEDQLVFSYGYH